MKTILIITITMLLTACATTSHSKCDAYGSVETSKDMAKK
jgi:hypothetical protein